MRSATCHRPLSRASRQLFRQGAAPILLHHFGGKGSDAPWRRHATTSPNELNADTRGRRRERISLVVDPEDGLADEEWYELLGFAIDESESTSSDTSTCPLHPKYDVLLQNDLNSFVIKRRYRSGVSKFGALSLPYAGRAARATLWMEEREAYHEKHVPMKRQRQLSGNSIFLFQCGICSKTFISRYYLDKHMGEHRPQNNEDALESDNLLCPADHVCDALGGMPACVAMMERISPYYGEGALTGKEYHVDHSKSLIASSFHSLVSHFYPSDDDMPDEGADEDEDQMAKRPEILKQRNILEGDVAKVTGEIRHRAARRNELILKAALHRQRKREGDSAEEATLIPGMFNEALFAYESDDQQDLQRSTSSSSCDDREQERLFVLCSAMMQNCFGIIAADDTPHTVANDLITQLCEPLHCNHRLHQMAGHDMRHAAHWSEQWDEHHSYTLGYSGWAVVVGVLIFYGCTYFGGWEDDTSQEQQKKKV